MKIAGIDCGTNSIRLLIAQAEIEAATGRYKLNDIVRKMEVVRLGAGVDKTGEFNPQALERTLAQVADYAQLCKEYEVHSIRFAATSATRDAKNREDFLNGVYQHLGIYPQVITGAQEAATSFAGAISGRDIHSEAEKGILAVDLGGGSTELALGDADGNLLASYSMDVGCVRIFERHFATGINAQSIAAARKDVQTALLLAREAVDLSQVQEVIGLAGTLTTLAATVLKLDTYDPDLIHGTQLAVADMERICDWYLASTLEQRQSFGFMHPGRADVITAGAVVWQEVMREIVASTKLTKNPLTTITISEHDILDGLALWALKAPQTPKYA